MTTTISRIEEPGRAEQLHAAIRDRHPHIAVSLTSHEATGRRLLYATSSLAGPELFGWDGATYRRWSGPDQNFAERLPDTPEAAADLIAEMVGTKQTPPAEE